MGVKIRLRRTGTTNDVCYRVVAADTRSPRDGRFIELLGWYDPKREGVNFKLDMDRLAHWQGEGAELSTTVQSLVRRARQADASAEPVAAEPELAEVAAAETAEEDGAETAEPEPDAVRPEAAPADA
jgi:small subunit ribosomal protein S16